MKPASSGNHSISFISRLALAVIATTVLALAASGLRAETPPDQVKDAGGIALTTDLLDSMDEFIKAVNGDPAAKNELNEIGKDPNMTAESWAAAVKAKCPKASAHLEAAEITAEDFAKGISAIIACAMGTDLEKSQDAKVKANAEFVKANNARADKIFSSFMELSMPAKP